MHFSHIIFSNENLDRKTLATSYPIRSHKGDLFNDVVRILFCFIYYYGARVHDCRGLGDTRARRTWRSEKDVMKLTPSSHLCVDSRDLTQTIRRESSDS